MCSPTVMTTVFLVLILQVYKKHGGEELMVLGSFCNLF